MNVMKMMAEAQKLQAQMQMIQTQLESKTVEVNAGNGAVRVTANGKAAILSIRINPDIVKKEDTELIEDLILTAVKQAQEKAHKVAAEEMAEVTKGMNIPGFNLGL